MAGKLIKYTVLLIAILIFNFALPRALPGSPIRNFGGDEMTGITESERQRIYETYDLDKPMTEQFFLYLKAIFTGELGISYSKKAPVTSILGAALPWTLLLAISNTVLSLFIGTALGALSVRLRRTKKDMPLIFGISFLGSFPAFWKGMVLIAVFSVSLGVLPMYGAYSMWENHTGLGHALDVARHMILPLVTMLLGSLMVFFTTSRASLLKVLSEDYIKMARLRGLPNSRVRFFYQWRNALIPVFTVLMLDLGYIFSGSVVIEAVFSYPGVGKILYDAVIKRDYPLMQYSFLLIAVTVIVMNLLTDLIYPVLDPRLRRR